MDKESTKNGMEKETAEIEALLNELSAIHAKLNSDVAKSSARPNSIHPNYHESARNLLFYLSLRRYDLRKLQNRLAAIGLSSLGQAEAHVMASVDSVLKILHRLSGDSWQPTEAALDFKKGQQLLSEHAETLFGPEPKGRKVRIMVTMPSEAASNPQIIKDLLQQGMNCMRINCAHDDETTWLKMIENLRNAERLLSKTCRIFMDLSGPKLRTGPIAPRPAVLRIRPRRDLYGKLIEAAQLKLSKAPVDLPVQSATSNSVRSKLEIRIPVTPQWLALLKVGEKIHFVDSRGSKRELTVVQVNEEDCLAELNKTAYVIPGTVLRREPRSNDHTDLETAVADFSVDEDVLLLNSGDILYLHKNLNLGHPKKLGSDGSVLVPAAIGCTLPEALSSVQLGDTIWFDDGKIGGEVEEIDTERLKVRITHSRIGGKKLRSDKGINLPESEIPITGITAQDIDDLPFVARHANGVALSFANSPQDVEILLKQLQNLDEKQVAIVLKIETKRGFENLPETLLTAMQWPSCAVMIARGDLAIEIGFERMAEVQEEILWICEAAHIPVIWATQVLETLAQTGLPSRAEISDAAMGNRAECVMLNKGPHICSAVQALDDILSRMQAHQAKKSSRLRELKLAQRRKEKRIPGANIPNDAWQKQPSC